MNIKSLLLGSAAALVAVSGARAADAIVAAEPEPVEYVRVCDAFGTGYFYIPGTETCLKLSGRVRYDMTGAETTRTINAVASRALIINNLQFQPGTDLLLEQGGSPLHNALSGAILDAAVANFAANQRDNPFYNAWDVADLRERIANETANGRSAARILNDLLDPNYWPNMNATKWNAQPGGFITQLQLILNGANRNAFAGTVAGGIATTLGIAPTSDLNGWTKTASGRLDVDTASDTELGTLATHLRFEGTASGGLNITQATISLGGLMVGRTDTLWDGDILGEFDTAGGSGVDQFRYTFNNGAFRGSVGLEVEDDNVDWLPNVVAKATYTVGGLSADLFAYYDDHDWKSATVRGGNDVAANSVLVSSFANGQEGDEFGAKAIIGYTIGASTVNALAIYNSGKSYYDNDYEWSLGGSITQAFSDTTSLTVGGQYYSGFLVGSKTWGDVTGLSDDAWKVGANLDQKLAGNLDLQLSANYGKADFGIAEVKTWDGRFRLTRSF